MSEVRARTFVKNLVERRNISYILPNGRILDTNETVEVKGILETQLNLAGEASALDEFLFDQVQGRVRIIYNIDGVTSETGGGGTLTPDDQNLIPYTTAFLNEQDTGITISNTPAGNGMVHIFINGQGPFTLGNGDKTSEFFFSGDGGATARAIEDITAGDRLYFNALIAGFALDTTDRLSFVEAVATV